jgi:hypothetical protein
MRSKLTRSRRSRVRDFKIIRTCFLAIIPGWRDRRRVFIYLISLSIPYTLPHPFLILLISRVVQPPVAISSQTALPTRNALGIDMLGDFVHLPHALMVAT